jgi:hypothetical protein
MAIFSFVNLAPRWRWIGRALVGALAVAGVLTGLHSLNRLARDRLREQTRFQLLFADILCDPPASLTRTAFLAEVQELSRPAGPVALLADEAPAEIARVFARHPWVEEVHRVEVLPTRQVRVELRYRTPVLAVLQPGEPRVVDRRGTLLPPDAASSMLPLLCGPVEPPAGPAGTPWGDETVSGAVRTIGVLRDQFDGLRLAQVETSVTGLVLSTAAGSRIFWGQPAGEKVDKATLRKCDRLRDYCRQHGDLDHPNGPCEHDLRSLD